MQEVNIYQESKNPASIERRIWKNIYLIRENSQKFCCWTAVQVGHSLKTCGTVTRFPVIALWYGITRTTYIGISDVPTHRINNTQQNPATNGRLITWNFRESSNLSLLRRASERNWEYRDSTCSRRSWMSSAVSRILTSFTIRLPSILAPQEAVVHQQLTIC